MRIPGLVSLLLIAACNKDAAPSVSVPDASAPQATQNTAPPAAAPVDAIDEPKTEKRGENSTVRYMGGSRGKDAKDWAILSFAIKNESDRELPVSSALSIQATTPAGLTGELDLMKSKCDGIAPPRGPFACIVKFDFPSPQPELRVRVAGAWFRIRLDERDGGK
jgi:hypothetical protein